MTDEQKKQVAHFYKIVFLGLGAAAVIMILFTAILVVKDKEIKPLLEMLWYIVPTTIVAGVAAIRGMSNINQ